MNTKSKIESFYDLDYGWKWLPSHVFQMLIKAEVVPTFSGESFEIDFHGDDSYGAHLVDVDHYSGHYRVEDGFECDLYIHWDENGKWWFNNIPKKKSSKGMVKAIKEYFK